MPFRLLPVATAVLATALVSACLPIGPGSTARTISPQTEPQPNAAPAGLLHSFSVERAYTLTDTRELAFRDQIAAEARAVCGLGDYSLYSSRPVGPEVVGDDFLYRAYDIQITCDG